MNENPIRVIFAGAVQNAECYLPGVLRNIENLSTLFYEVGYIFIENDSTDNTKKILNDWGINKSYFQLISLDGLKDIPIRTLRLELIRNTYIEVIRYNSELSCFDYLIILDMDNVGMYLINIEEASNAIDFLSSSTTRAAVFANQKGTYYDMWALRLTSQCPCDVWEEVLDYAIKYNCSDEVAYSQTFSKRIFSIEESLSPIKVNSAFGGFGIYKMKFILNNPNPYLGSKIKIIPLGNGKPYYARWQVCEHVHFHLGIKNQGGEMYIYPKLINGVNHDRSYPPSAFRMLLF
jgi:glycosyltransferase involved in cell wall biosynthesis